ncbi:MAG TPA: phosphoribosylformylglycinamidine synthase subunit PurQ [Bacteroidetes bacterium]|nr:phosphoribosylformylglycinamidine synthase subunit PurQ [Bacteroidota bacterium]
MKFGIVVFPGSNCDHDVYDVVKRILGHEPRFLWHKNHTLEDSDIVILPGGFSYGDYLRTGAIARFSPIMREVVDFAKKGRPVMGICNGFQILLETGLLPGAMLRNESLRFVCRFVNVRVENANTPFSGRCDEGQVLKIPIAHNEGNYYADPDTLEALEGNGQVVLRYCEANGEVTRAANPNGSLHNIAGIVNRQGNVFGLMPHPERASELLLGSEDGKRIFESIIESFS